MIENNKIITIKLTRLWLNGCKNYIENKIMEFKKTAAEMLEYYMGHRDG